MTLFERRYSPQGYWAHLVEVDREQRVGYLCGRGNGASKLGAEDPEREIAAEKPLCWRCAIKRESILSS